MRKTFLLLFTLISLSAYSQRIDLDKVDDDFRYILCSQVNVSGFKDKIKMSVSLNAGVNLESDYTFYNIGFALNSLYPITIPNEGKLLIKFQDDSVLELKTNQEYSDDIGSVKNINGAVFTQHTIYPAYKIGEEDVPRLFQGVKKIRFETTTENIDKEFKKDKIGEALKTEYLLIKEALKKDKSFSDGF